MGQAQSNEPVASPSSEEITKQLANKFAEKCFTSLELYSLKDNFKGLADQQQGVRYLKEDTISRFLEIPDVLGACPVLFHMVSYVAAFPFLQDAPAVLGLEQMVIVITIFTERYRRVLAKGSQDRRKLLFKSLAVYDKKLSEQESNRQQRPADGKQPGSSEPGNTSVSTPGFAVDQVGEEELDDAADDDDDLVMAAFESLDYIAAFKQGNAPTIHGAMVPPDNFRKLVMLLLVIAPLDPQENLSQHSARVVGDELENLRSTAESVLSTFMEVEKSPGIKFKHFESVLPVCFPHLFGGLNALFEHFLFSKNLDFTKHRDGQPAPLLPSDRIPQPLLQDKGEILDLNVLSQLSFFIPGSDLFRRLRLLYSGGNDGFSMGSFETKVFNWRAPTILLVRGTRLDDIPHKGQESSFAAMLPPRRFPHGSSAERLTFGAYLGQPWRHTNRECFGESDSVLFQLDPIHDVFPASSLNRDYACFTKTSATSQHGGISFGCVATGAPAQSFRRTGLVSLGPVSLLLDSSFEFGVFTHDNTSRGGAFSTSAARCFDFQDRFEIESLEVWGCGGDAEAKVQAERWAWEAREAEARRRINLGTGDIEADRALLEMAGLIGQNRSGGSIN